MESEKHSFRLISKAHKPQRADHNILLNLASPVTKKIQPSWSLCPPGANYTCSVVTSWDIHVLYTVHKAILCVSLLRWLLSF